MKEFDLTEALNGAKLVTRDGQEVRNFRKRKGEDDCFECPIEEYPIEEYPYCFEFDGCLEVCTESGRYYRNGRESSYDLFLADDDDQSEQPIEMVKIYLSGAITGRSEIQLERSFGFFERKFKELGYEVVNPLNNGLTNEESWADHMIADLQLLKGCDILATMDEWTKSEGAKMEVMFAKKMGIQVVDAEDFITEITNKNDQTK